MPFDPENPPAKVSKLPAKKQRQWVGRVFGRLTVVEQLVGKRGKPVQVFRCRCECGKEKDIEGSRLYGAGRTVKSCGCGESFQPISDDLAGKQFGRWTVTGKASKSNYWSCRCECGEEKDVFRGSLTRGVSVSCGCWKKDGDWIRSGGEHHSWNPDLNDEDRRNQKKHWGMSNRFVRRVFERDDYTCSVCHHRGGELQAHHIDSWDWCKERRFDESNLSTTCVECHKEFHRIYGRGRNTEAQFVEFKEGRHALQVA